MGGKVSTAEEDTTGLGDEDQVKGDCAGSLYSLVNLQGRGELIDLTQDALLTGDWEPLDRRLTSDQFKKYLYNDGDGEFIAYFRLIERRNDRTDKKPILATNVKRRKSNVVQPTTVLRRVCWRLDQRGAVGETILHLCFLMGSEFHIQLAKRLSRFYPHLINDIYVGDLYYGESCLHIAIVNEDISLVKYLVSNGAAVNERCSGSYFMPTDQLDSRRDTYEHEWYKIKSETNYEGLCYYGEYPLLFAVSLGQVGIVNYLWSKGADINIQDTNGNTAMHMAVLYNRKDMVQLVYELGCDPQIVNRQGFTAFSLSAVLSRVEIFHYIIALERRIQWKFVNVTCAQYRLDNLDSINSDGSINDKSALYVIMNETSVKDDTYLSSLNGLIKDLMIVKWKKFGRFQFYLHWVEFLLYLSLLNTVFYMRPAEDRKAEVRNFGYLQNFTISSSCYLMYTDLPEEKFRILCELLLFIGAFINIIVSVRKFFNLGAKTFFKVVKISPTNILFKVSCCFVVMASFCRIPPCFPYVEDIFAIIAVMTTWPYFLFFMRGYQKFGPFIFMIYTMMRSDLVMFLILYLVMLISFTQSFHVVYLGVPKGFQYADSLTGMFVLSLGEIQDIYDSFELTKYPSLAKFLFVIFMLFVNLLLLNLFIAMMGKTFETIDNAHHEWFRQWGQIILVLEQNLSPRKRKAIFHEYSTPGWHGPGSRAISLQSENETYDVDEIAKSYQRHVRFKAMIFKDGKRQAVAPSQPSSIKDVMMKLSRVDVAKTESSHSSLQETTSENATLIV